MAEAIIRASVPELEGLGLGLQVSLWSVFVEISLKPWTSVEGHRHSSEPSSALDLAGSLRRLVCLFGSLATSQQ